LTALTLGEMLDGLVGPWQIAATGLRASKNALANATAFGIIRSLSGLMTPPVPPQLGRNLELYCV
jgi:hypothetical protein